MEIFKSDIIRRAEEYNEALEKEKKRAVAHAISFANEVLASIKNVCLERNMEDFKEFLVWLIKKGGKVENYMEIPHRYFYYVMTTPNFSICQQFELEIKELEQLFSCPSIDIKSTE